MYLVAVPLFATSQKAFVSRIVVFFCSSKSKACVSVRDRANRL